MILLCMFVMSVVAITDLEKKALCDTLTCESNERDGKDSNACGIKEEGAGFRLRLFENECELLKYGCEVGKGEEYGLTNRHYCSLIDLNGNSSKVLIKHSYEAHTDNQLFSEEMKFSKENDKVDVCEQLDCKNYTNENNVSVCAIRNDDRGFCLRKLANECVLQKLNCKGNFTFVHTDIQLCTDLEVTNEDSIQTEDYLRDSKYKEKDVNNDIRKEKQNFIVINGSMLDFHGNINDSVDGFFASTHYLKFPITEVALDTIIKNDTRRNLFLKQAAPKKVFVPAIITPRNKTIADLDTATLMTCFHKCPQKCPDTYAPVCGTPGILAREPSVMFQNHCYMDQAQCKMHYENKSLTSSSSAYVEGSFLFCLGNELLGLYRFLPLVKSLQHMGRLKRRGDYHYSIKNFRYFNNYLMRQPNIMG